MSAINKAAGVGKPQAAQNQNTQQNFNTIDSKLSAFLSCLDGVKNTAPNKWVAQCPAHDDRSPSLAIKQADDRILLHCFAGCGVTEVLHSVGLTTNDLFPDRIPAYGAPRPKPPRFSPYELFPLLIQEAVILALAFNEAITDGSLNDADKQRAIQAFNSVMRLNSEVAR